MGLFDFLKKSKKEEAYEEVKEPQFEEITFDERPTHTDYLQTVSENYSQLEDDVNEFLSEEEVEIVTLYDERGIETDFILLDTIKIKKRYFAVLLEESEADDGEILILETVRKKGETEYIGFDDDDLLRKVFKLFKEKNKDKIEFEI